MMVPKGEELSQEEYLNGTEELEQVRDPDQPRRQREAMLAQKQERIDALTRDLKADLEYYAPDEKEQT